MKKVRPCKLACGYPALKGRQFCMWHALMRLSSDEQAAAARRRLAQRHPDTYQARVDKKYWPEGERWCSGCQSFVPLFYCSGSKCKACASSSAHARRVADTYGITPEQYDEIFRRQGGRCAICGNRPRTIRFAVDHDHKTGQVRGILCKRCNHDLLGGGHDDVLVLWRALSYLLFPPAGAGSRPTEGDVIDALRERLRLHGRLSEPRHFEPEDPPF